MRRRRRFCTVPLGDAPPPMSRPRATLPSPLPPLLPSPSLRCGWASMVRRGAAHLRAGAFNVLGSARCGCRGYLRGRRCRWCQRVEASRLWRGGTARRHGCLVALRARDAPRRRAHQRGGEARSQPAPVRGACAALIRSPTTLISNEALRLAQCRSVRRQGGVCRAAWSRAGGHAHLARSSNHVSVLFRSVALRV